MWIRSAFWIGALKPGTQASFEHLMNSVLMPAFKKLPGVHDARALWPRVREDNPPEIVCQIIVEFHTRADVDRMLASPERASLRTHVLEAKTMFEGHFSHIDYEVGEP